LLRRLDSPVHPISWQRHPRELGTAEVSAFLSHLAIVGKVSASTQNQAKSAIMFLYKSVLEAELPRLDNVVSAKATRRLPVVLTQAEVRDVLALVDGTSGLILRLIYGTGMRILECLRLR
jgi:site-specific recombinase XerD